LPRRPSTARIGVGDDLPPTKASAKGGRDEFRSLSSWPLRATKIPFAERASASRVTGVGRDSHPNESIGKGWPGCKAPSETSRPLLTRREGGWRGGRCALDKGGKASVMVLLICF
jgi:hypothetical protein